MIGKRVTAILMVFSMWIFIASTPATADSEPEGLWYGTFEVTEGLFAGYSNLFSMNFVYSEPYGLLASMQIPDFGIFGDFLPVSISGDIVTIYDPYYGSMEITGKLEGNSLNGESPYGFYAWLEVDNMGWQYFAGTWKAEKYIPLNELPGEAPGPPCDGLPSLYCIGDREYCSELVQFTPDAGDGYINQAYEGFRYIRRDLMMLIKYATAKTACKTDGWDYGNKGPLGLIDMSEADGSTPKDSYGNYLHPPGSHEEGRDIDTAYYQLYSADNLARIVGLSYDYHLIEPPYNFDRYRTALYISYLAEHPLLRVVGVDGQIGLILDGEEGTLNELVEEEWIDEDLRASIPLAYEVEDTGLGWFRHHHHHLHVSMNQVYDVVSSVEIKPDTLNRYSHGNYVTVHMEFIESIDVYQIDPNNIISIALILNGHTMLYAEPEDITVSDYNKNGIYDLTVKFDRQEVLESIGEGNVEISIMGMTGIMIDDDLYGVLFQESDAIHVIGPPAQARKNNKPVIPFVRPGGRQFLPE
jgi:hypothetical protein